LTREHAEQDFPFLLADFPNTHRAAWETVWLPQPVLLGSQEDMWLVIGAIEKIQKYAIDLH
jgi:hypothetical protein